MKKFLIIALVLALLLQPAAMATPQIIDLATMTLEELQVHKEDVDAAIDALTPYETLRQGDEGNGVLKIQVRLIALSYMNREADGQFGKMTTSALLRFQDAEGLDATGIADPDTQAALFSEYATPYTPPLPTPKPTVMLPAVKPAYDNTYDYDDDTDDDYVDTVWIPKSGKKYHNTSSCSNMKNPQEVTLSEAKRRGFTACKKCW